MELRQQQTFLGLFFFWAGGKIGDLIGVEVELLGLSYRHRLQSSNVQEQLHQCFPDSQTSPAAAFANTTRSWHTN